jgi:type IV secretory pathway TraG/TraD family ATPase VirD4
MAERSKDTEFKIEESAHGGLMFLGRSFNPLATAKSTADAEAIALAIATADGASDPFWRESKRQLICALIGAEIAAKPEGERSFRAIGAAVEGRDLDELRERFDMMREAATSFEAFASASPETCATVMMEVTKLLARIQ